MAKRQANGATNSLVKRECEGCTIYHHSQTQQQKSGSTSVWPNVTGELIRMVYASNNKPMPNIEVSSDARNTQTINYRQFQIGNIGSVSAEEMILNFMHNMDLFSYN